MQAPWIFGKRVPHFSIEVHDGSTVSIVITQVWAYRELFEAEGIQGGRMGATDTSKGEFVRLLPKIDLSKDGEQDRVVHVIKNVMRNLAMRVPVDGTVEAESPVSKLLETLRAMSNMHFV